MSQHREFDPADVRYLVQHGYTQSGAESYLRGHGSPNRTARFDLSNTGRRTAIGALQHGQAEDDLEALAGLSVETGTAMIVAATKELAQYNLNRFPKISQVARREAATSATQLNEFMQQAFNASLDELYPAWREDMVGAAAHAQRSSIELTRDFEKNVLPGYLQAVDEMSAQALSNTQAELRGEINPDVAAQLERYSAEVSQSIGVRGQSAQYLTARDLGLTSYQVQQQGLQNSQAALGIAPLGYAQANQTLQAPVATGINASNLIRSYQAPIVDASSLYTQNLGILSGAGTINPSQAYGNNAQTYLGAGKLVQGGQQFATDQYWNGVNYSAQQQAAAEARQGGGFGGVLSGSLTGFVGGAMTGNLGLAFAGAGLGAAGGVENY